MPQIDMSPLLNQKSVSDYLNQNRKMEQDAAINDEKIKAVKMEKAVKYLGMATPENWQAIRSQAIQEGLGNEDTLPTQYDSNWINKTRQAFGLSTDIDADKLGEAAFLKAAQGMPLSSQEEAALKYIDAKQQTATINPVTGATETKPSLLNRAGISLSGMMLQPPARLKPTQTTLSQHLFSSNTGSPSEWDAEYEKQLQLAEGNPKLQQSIMQDYAKAKISMTESEAKNSGFADRMYQSDPIIDETTDASTNMWERTKANVPFVGNYLKSDEYQSAEQAQRDFINSILRRESGAVISPSEFENASKQYFPHPGDSKDVIAQKKANREAAIKGIERSAGPAYKPIKPKLNGTQPATGERPPLSSFAR